MMEKGYLCVIEWDGLKPPNTFYGRLRKLTSGVRGDKALSPINRRSRRVKTAIIMQEGAIYCSDEQLARVIALLAEQHGAQSVEIGTVFDMRAIVADEYDLKALRRVEEVCGARGKPSVDEISQKWTVYCYKEMEIIVIAGQESTRKPINCPHCGSFMIRTIQGTQSQSTYVGKEESGCDLYEIWLNCRFITSRFIPRSVKIDARISINLIKNHYDGKWPIVAKEFIPILYAVFTKSDFSFLNAFIDNPTLGIQLLDSMFVGRWLIRPETRQRDRITAISAMLNEVRDIRIDQIAERDEAIDFYDAAANLDLNTLVSAFKRMVEYYRYESETPPEIFRFVN